MKIDRREFLVAAGIAALAPLAVAARRWQSIAAAAAPALRPEPLGASAGVCARCGGQGHDALDPCCPRGNEARIALQAAARHKARPPRSADG